ncbi:hypothetical protein E4U42_001459 [Claviceps africana]|uniref:Transmembrane protein n=1 Tax=Claviceps africana TaxID=83212 RepID=A0A8K0J9V1_9HYPO|nr:hypothetical protein E4U42_001459 [Claviceps africana]
MMLFVYLALPFVSGRYVYGYVVASSIRGQGYEPATAKHSVSLLGLEGLKSRKTGQHIRGLGAAASSLTANDAPPLQISSREIQHGEGTVLDVPSKRSEATAGPRYSDAEQASRRQAESYLPASKPSLILVGAKDKLWDNIGLITGIIATLAFCIVLGILYLVFTRRKQDCSQGDACRDVSSTGQPPHRSIKSVASIQSHEFFVPGTPNPTWQLPLYHAVRHKEQQQPSGTSPMWMPHNVVSPIDSLDGSAHLSNYHPSPIESLQSPIQQPPASYHWQSPVELPATATAAHDQTRLPTYGEASAGGRQWARFSWTQDAEAAYRPSERPKN